MLTPTAVDGLGRRLIAYMLAIDVGELDHVLAEPDGDQAAVFALLEQIAAKLAVRSAGLPSDQHALELTALVSALDEAPLANRIRHLVASSPQVDISDPPRGLLQAIALDALPALIAEDEHKNPTEPWRTVGFSLAAIYNHPAHVRFVRAVLDDADLRRLFPGVDASGEAFGFHQYASGTGSTVQVAMFASSLIEAAWADTENDTPDAILAALDASLSQARTLGRDSVVEAVHRIGFRGLALTGPQTVHLPWGTLRARTPRDFQLGLRFSGFGDVYAQVDAVLEDVRAIGVDISESMPEGDDTWMDSVRSWHEASTLMQRKVALSVLLALTRDEPVAISPVAEHVAKPVAGGDSISWQPSQFARPTAELTDGDVQRIRDSAARVEQFYSPRIDIAVARTLRSLAERGDPVDGLIDAVIALESLFSAGQGELKLRISASIAWLLEPDDVERRKALYAETKKLYDTRSDVLHGRPLSPEAAVPKHQRAAAIAIDVLRTLFEQRTDLIADTNRAENLLVVGRGRDVDRSPDPETEGP